MTQLAEHYKKAIAPELMKRFGYKTPMQVPRIVKITLNMGVGEAAIDKKHMTAAMADMAKISGQKPVMTLAKKSIAGFKIREGWPIGCKVTLRRGRMYDFLERLIHLALPRVRDFRGIKPVFDGRGNFSLGLREQIVFPEINYDDVETVRGLDVVMTIKAKTDEEAKALLEAFRFPFRETKK